ncbi:ABC transporter substrate-binding protein [Thioalkalivibrio sp. XN279]|uniref:ABC transporter substrate-binding protein n=1 Tax=Thioalkalivibrio sp. XN279 TaxID=2714953 RepID=UPI001408BBB1|nr:ABC transporter substrate-binding protein [Thioalkalivibrio sp. XN279]
MCRQAMAAAVIAAVALVSALANSPAAIAVTAAPADPASSVVRIAGSDWVMDAPTKVAAARGYFNASGYAGPRIEASYHASGRDALAALLRDEVDYALSAPTPVARALLDHLDRPDRHPAIVVLASLGISGASHYIIARRDRGIEQPTDLAGKRLGLLKQSSAHFSWSLLEGLYGLEEGSVVLVNLPVQEQAAALAAGQVDAVLSWDPYARQLRESLGEQAVVFSNREVASPNWLLVSRLAEMRSRPQVAERVLEGYRKAVELVDADPAQAAQLVATESPAGPTELDLAGAGLFWNLTLNWAVLSNLEEQMHWWRRIDGARGRPVAAPASYLWAAPLQAVAPEAVVLPDHLLRHPGAGGGPVHR